MLSTKLIIASLATSSFLFVSTPTEKLFEENGIVLEKAGGYTAKKISCLFNDGRVTVEVIPATMIANGWNDQSQCAHIRCLFETGMACW